MSRGKAYELWIYKHRHFKIATEAFLQHWVSQNLSYLSLDALTKTAPGDPNHQRGGKHSPVFLGRMDAALRFLDSATCADSTILASI